METRDVLLKADKVSVVFERIADGKIRVTTSSWDDAKVIWPNQVLEVATIGKQVELVRVDKPIAYLDIDDTGLAEAGTVRRRNESQRDSDLSQRDSDEVTRFMASAAERMRLSRKRKKLRKMVIPWVEVTDQEIDYLRRRGYGARQGDQTAVSEAGDKPVCGETEQ